MGFLAKTAVEVLPTNEPVTGEGQGILGALLTGILAYLASVLDLIDHQPEVGHRYLRMRYGRSRCPASL